MKAPWLCWVPNEDESQQRLNCNLPITNLSNRIVPFLCIFSVFDRWGIQWTFKVLSQDQILSRLFRKALRKNGGSVGILRFLVFRFCFFFFKVREQKKRVGANAFQPRAQVEQNERRTY